MIGCAHVDTAVNIFILQYNFAARPTQSKRNRKTKQPEIIRSSPSKCWFFPSCFLFHYDLRGSHQETTSKPLPCILWLKITSTPGTAAQGPHRHVPLSRVRGQHAELAPAKNSSSLV